MIFLTSDYHLFHRNILKYCDRPFENTFYMHKAIVENYCSLVKEEDTVYFLGDLTMLSAKHVDKVGKITKNLPGTKHLIIGNHDKLRMRSYLKIGFKSVHTSLEISFGDYDFTLVHDPKELKDTDTYGLFGHVHNNFKHLDLLNGKKGLNVGVDVNNFFPISEKQVLKEMGL